MNGGQLQGPELGEELVNVGVAHPKVEIGDQKFASSAGAGECTAQPKLISQCFYWIWPLYSLGLIDPFRLRGSILILDILTPQTNLSVSK